jgi:hypothetical protein
MPSPIKKLVFAGTEKSPHLISISYKPKIESVKPINAGPSVVAKNQNSQNINYKVLYEL